MIINAADFNNEIIRAARDQSRTGGTKQKAKHRYKDLICAFDIETTRIAEIEQAVMYIWQFQIDELCTVIGRTWEQFQRFTEAVCEALADDERLVIYVHNLSYEFQFLSGIYPFRPSEVFAVDSRKVLKCSMFDKLEFRCSYLQTNMSLSEFTKKMQVKHTKLDGGEFNYELQRFPWTELTNRELEYCINDVLGLVEAIKAECERDHDNLYTIPMTSTGYVRRDARKVMMPRKLRAAVKEQQPDLELYLALRDAFRGGDTHASRFYAGRIITDVESVDRSSSYPDVIINCKFPVTPFYHKGPLSLQDYLFYTQKGRAMVLRIAMTNVRLHDDYNPVPYIPRAKCQQCIKPVLDNGRILAAEYLEMSVTDIDMKIILAEYDADSIEITDSWHARYGYLPRAYRNLVISYYKKKTELKGVEGQEVYYTKLKNLLNALYGMMAQDPVKQTIEFVKGEFIESTYPVNDLLNEATRKAFLCYQYGVWVTAHARRELREAIRHAGAQFVYCDTDSVKYVKNPPVDWEQLNAPIRARARDNDAIATDPGGTTHYTGVWECDDAYTEFKTLGAKKYAYVYQGKKCKEKCSRNNCALRNTGGACCATFCTIAGVGKAAGAAELDRSGGLRAFTEGFIFTDGGGLESVYNDFDYGAYIIDGHKLNITRNVVLRPSTYTVGITTDYSKLLADDTIIKKFMEEIQMANYSNNRRGTKAAKAEEAEAKAERLEDIISDVRIYETGKDDGIVANVSVTFCGVFCVTGFKLVEGRKGLFVSMPSYKYQGEYKDSAFPLSKRFREILNDAVIEAWENGADK